MKNAVIYFLVFTIGMLAGIAIYKLLLPQKDCCKGPMAETSLATSSYIISDGDFDKHTYVIGPTKSGKYCIAAYPIAGDGSKQDVAFATIGKETSLTVAPASGGKTSIVLSSSEIAMHTRQAKEIKLPVGTPLVTASGLITGQDGSGNAVTISIGRVIYIKGRETSGGIVVGYVDLNDIGTLPLNSTK